MTARDVLIHSLPFNSYQQRNEVADAFRAEVLREAADFVRDAHFRDGLSVQEIGTALRLMADATTPTAAHMCGNCDGVDPDSCLMNAKYHPDLKEQQR